MNKRPQRREPTPGELHALIQAFNGGRHAELERLAQAMTQAHPHFALGWKALGVALKQNAKTSAALVPLQKAVQLCPNDAEAHCNLGVILKSLGRREEAVASFGRALGLDPRNLLSMVSLGRLHADEGRMADAAAQFQKVLKIDPENPDALAQWASLRTMTAADRPWLDKAAGVVARPSCPTQHKVALLHAMGKYCDDTRDYTSAFAHHRQANEIKKSLHHKHVPQQLTALTDRLINGHSSSWAAMRHAGASEAARPLFIVGLPRSGTSLLEQILASHAATHGAGELRFWADAIHRYPDTLTAGCYPEPVLASLARECLAELERHDRNALRVVDKMPGNFQRLGLIHAVFPQARILHARRNPVDTCLSIYFQNFHGGHPYANDLDDLAHYYREYHRLMTHWRNVLPPDVFMDVDYEALVEDQAGWSRRVIEFIGLEWDEKCLDFFKTERRVGTASNWQARQPIYKSSRERWRNYAAFVQPLLPLLELHSPACNQGAD